MKYQQLFTDCAFKSWRVGEITCWKIRSQGYHTAIFYFLFHPCGVCALVGDVLNQCSLRLFSVSTATASASASAGLSGISVGVGGGAG